MAIDFRWLYTLADLLTAYFRICPIPWSGEKESIRYFQEHDLEYLTLFDRCPLEQDRAKKIQISEDTTQRTLAPLEGKWQHEVTAFAIAPGTLIEPKTLDQLRLSGNTS